MGFRTLLGIRMAFLAICGGVVMSGMYPPVSAQQTTMQVITVTDAKQDKDISFLAQRIDNVERVTERNALDIAGLHGEERLFGSLLTLLSGVSIVLQVKKKAAGG